MHRYGILFMYLCSLNLDEEKIMATKKVKKKNGRTTMKKTTSTGTKTAAPLKKLPSITKPYSKGIMVKTVADLSSTSRKVAAK